MVKLLECLDYRAYLREWMEERRQQGGPMSYRWLAQRLDLDPGFLVNIVLGRKHIPESALPALIRVLKLRGRHAVYLKKLVAFNRARSDVSIARTFAELSQIRDLSVTALSEKQYRYWMEWYYPAVRIYLLAQTFTGNYEELAANIDPPLTVKQAKEAIQILLDLDLVEWNKAKVLEPKQAFVSTGDAWQNGAIHRFQEQTLELARRSIYHHSGDDREISTLTLAIAHNDIPELQDMIREFREKILNWVSHRTEADQVVQINIAAFPLSKSPEADS